jgi:tripartite-type tricarboxylate transporter receptor subunit TctC
VPSVVKPGFRLQATAWNGLFAPGDAPQPSSTSWSTLNKALDDPETRKRLDVLGGDIPDKANRGRRRSTRW